MSECLHAKFAAQVTVTRITDVEGWIAEARINCRDCGTWFRVVGVEEGIFGDRPSTDPSGTTLRVPISPTEGPDMPARGIPFADMRYGGGGKSDA